MEGTMIKWIFILVIWMPCSALALTSEQILSAQCRADLEGCAQSQGFQFYMGGLLDAVAHYQETQTAAGEPALYCRPASELFDMSAILRHLAKLPPALSQRNTTVGVLDYLAENGGCRQ